jgi:hypothetical protein
MMLSTGAVLTAVRDHIESQVGGAARAPVDAWHYSPWLAELRAASEDMALTTDSHSYSLAVSELTYAGIDGGGWPRDAGSGREVYGHARVQVMWRVAVTYDGDPHDEYVRAWDDAHQLIASLLARPIGAPPKPITIGLLSTRAAVTESRYVEGVTEIEARFPLYLSTGG